MKGRIIKVISNDYTVKLDNDIKVVCKPRGVFRNINMTPFAGDIVEIDEDKKIITKILDRKNKLNRPPVCNIDCAIIVTSTTNIPIIIRNFCFLVKTLLFLAFLLIFHLLCNNCFY